MVYFNSIFVLWSEGALIYEGVIRMCCILNLVHAYKRGYIVWIISTFAIANILEVIWATTGAYCKAESLIMFGHCKDLSLHAGFWTTWVYPSVLAIHRLGLPKFSRPFAIAILVQCYGLPCDLAITASGMIYFASVHPNSWVFVGTTMFPDAFSQHLFAGLGSGLLVELLLHFGEIELDQAFGYPNISAGKQIVIGMFGVAIGYYGMQNGIRNCSNAIFGDDTYWYLLSLAVCGLMFAKGMTKRTPPSSTEKDLMAFIGPSLLLLCNLGYEVAHLLNGFLVTPVDPINYYFLFTPSMYMTAIGLTCICAALFIGISVFAFNSINAPLTYKPLV